MDEKKEEAQEGKEAKQDSEKDKQETTGKTEDTGDKPEVYKPIDDANLAAKRLEDANKERRDLLDREEDLIAKRALAGNAEAGGKMDKKKEETPKEYAKRVMENDVEE